METQTQAQLPRTAEDCRTLSVWRTLVRGESQDVVAQRGHVKQARISEVELGKVIPRKRYWANLIAAFGLSEVPDAASHFYRMLMTARNDWLRLQALKKPITQTEPLIAAAQVSAKPVLTVAEVESNRRALA